MTGAGAVLARDNVEERRAPGDTAGERSVFLVGDGDRCLEQRVLRCSPGRSRPRETGAAEEVLYVVRGAGRVIVDGEPYAVEPDTGVHLAPAERWEVENPGPSDLELVAVRVPQPPAAAGRTRRVVARVADQQAEAATAGREFRIVAACRGATAFVGAIPPGRAPDHFHRYDEVIYVLRGAAVVHLAEGARPASPGDCIHLPARVVHAVENTGAEPLEVLGVFRPAGSPSDAYYVDGTPAMSSPGGTS